MSVLKYFYFPLLLSPLWSTQAQGMLLGWEFGLWWLLSYVQTSGPPEVWDIKNVQHFCVFLVIQPQMCEEKKSWCFQVNKRRWVVLDYWHTHEVLLALKPVYFVGAKAASYAACDHSGQPGKNKLGFHLWFPLTIWGHFCKILIAMLASPVSKDFGADNFSSSNFFVCLEEAHALLNIHWEQTPRGGCLLC